jgi:hypothetical protein
MAKQFITEAARMQKLAGIKLNESAEDWYDVKGEIYVVNKKENDKWLMAGDNSSYTYQNRPWAKTFSDLESAFEYANNASEEVEIELPNGTVLGKDNNNWIEIFT